MLSSSQSIATALCALAFRRLSSVGCPPGSVVQYVNGITTCRPCAAGTYWAKTLNATGATTVACVACPVDCVCPLGSPSPLLAADMRDYLRRGSFQSSEITTTSLGLFNPYTPTQLFATLGTRVGDRRNRARRFTFFIGRLYLCVLFDRCSVYFSSHRSRVW